MEEFSDKNVSSEKRLDDKNDETVLPTITCTTATTTNDDVSGNLTDEPATTASSLELSPNDSNETAKTPRIIKNMFILDPSKLKDLGIQSKVINAMSKLNSKTNSSDNKKLGKKSKTKKEKSSNKITHSTTTNSNTQSISLTSLTNVLPQTLNNSIVSTNNQITPLPPIGSIISLSSKSTNNILPPSTITTSQQEPEFANILQYESSIDNSQPTNENLIYTSTSSSFLPINSETFPITNTIPSTTNPGPSSVSAPKIQILSDVKYNECNPSIKELLSKIKGSQSKSISITLSATNVSISAAKNLSENVSEIQPNMVPLLPHTSVIGAGSFVKSQNIEVDAHQVNEEVEDDALEETAEEIINEVEKIEEVEDITLNKFLNMKTYAKPHEKESNNFQNYSSFPKMPPDPYKYRFHQCDDIESVLSKNVIQKSTGEPPQHIVHRKIPTIFEPVIKSHYHAQMILDLKEKLAPSLPTKSTTEQLKKSIEIPCNTKDSRTTIIVDGFHGFDDVNNSDVERLAEYTNYNDLLNNFQNYLGERQLKVLKMKPINFNRKRRVKQPKKQSLNLNKNFNNGSSVKVLQTDCIDEEKIVNEIQPVAAPSDSLNEKHIEDRLNADTDSANSLPMPDVEKNPVEICHQIDTVETVISKVPDSENYLLVDPNDNKIGDASIEIVTPTTISNKVTDKAEPQFKSKRKKFIPVAIAKKLNSDVQRPISNKFVDSPICDLPSLTYIENPNCPTTTELIQIGSIEHNLVITEDQQTDLKPDESEKKPIEEIAINELSSGDLSENVPKLGVAKSVIIDKELAPDKSVKKMDENEIKEITIVESSTDSLLTNQLNSSTILKPESVIKKPLQRRIKAVPMPIAKKIKEFSNVLQPEPLVTKDKEFAPDKSEMKMDENETKETVETLTDFPLINTPTSSTVSTPKSEMIVEKLAPDRSPTKIIENETIIESSTDSSSTNVPIIDAPSTSFAALKPESVIKKPIQRRIKAVPMPIAKKIKEVSNVLQPSVIIDKKLVLDKTENKINEMEIKDETTIVETLPTSSTILKPKSVMIDKTVALDKPEEKKDDLKGNATTTEISSTIVPIIAAPLSSSSTFLKPESVIKKPTQRRIKAVPMPIAKKIKEVSKIDQKNVSPSDPSETFSSCSNTERNTSKVDNLHANVEPTDNKPKIIVEQQKPITSSLRQNWDIGIASTSKCLPVVSKIKFTEKFEQKCVENVGEKMEKQDLERGKIDDEKFIYEKGQPVIKKICRTESCSTSDKNEPLLCDNQPNLSPLRTKIDDGHIDDHSNDKTIMNSSSNISKHNLSLMELLIDRVDKETLKKDLLMREMSKFILDSEDENDSENDSSRYYSDEDEDNDEKSVENGENELESPSFENLSVINVTTKIDNVDKKDPVEMIETIEKIDEIVEEMDTILPLETIDGIDVIAEKSPEKEIVIPVKVIDNVDVIAEKETVLPVETIDEVDVIAEQSLIKEIIFFVETIDNVKLSPTKDLIIASSSKLPSSADNFQLSQSPIESTLLKLPFESIEVSPLKMPMGDLETESFYETNSFDSFPAFEVVAHEEVISTSEQEIDDNQMKVNDDGYYATKWIMEQMDDEDRKQHERIMIEECDWLPEVDHIEPNKIETEIIPESVTQPTTRVSIVGTVEAKSLTALLRSTRARRTKKVTKSIVNEILRKDNCHNRKNQIADNVKSNLVEQFDNIVEQSATCSTINQVDDSIQTKSVEAIAPEVLRNHVVEVEQVAVNPIDDETGDNSTVLISDNIEPTSFVEAEQSASCSAINNVNNSIETMSESIPDKPKVHRNHVVHVEDAIVNPIDDATVDNSTLKSISDNIVPTSFIEVEQSETCSTINKVKYSSQTTSDDQANVSNANLIPHEIVTKDIDIVPATLSIEVDPEQESPTTIENDEPIADIILPKPLPKPVYNSASVDDDEINDEDEIITAKTITSTKKKKRRLRFSTKRRKPKSKVETSLNNNENQLHEETDDTDISSVDNHPESSKNRRVSENVPESSLATNEKCEINAIKLNKNSSIALRKSSRRPTKRQAAVALLQLRNAKVMKATTESLSTSSDETDNENNEPEEELAVYSKPGPKSKKKLNQPIIKQERIEVESSKIIETPSQSTAKTPETSPIAFAGFSSPESLPLPSTSSGNAPTNTSTPIPQNVDRQKKNPILTDSIDQSPISITDEPNTKKRKFKNDATTTSIVPASAKKRPFLNIDSIKREEISITSIPECTIIVSNEGTDILPTTKKRRCAKKATNYQEMEEDDSFHKRNNNGNTFVAPTPPSPSTPMAKSRGRKKRQLNDAVSITEEPSGDSFNNSSGNVQSEENTFVVPTPPLVKKARGRKKILPSFMDDTLAEETAAKEVQCGNCNETMTGKHWEKHLLSHYGLSWRVNIDEPVDMTSMNEKLKFMNRYLRVQKITAFVCRLCSTVKKSAAGYLSHIEVCGLTEEELSNVKVQCKYCPSILRTISVQYHEMYCSGLKLLRQMEAKNIKTENAEEKPDNIESTPDLDESDSNRPSRKSAQKAKQTLKKYQADDDEYEFDKMMISAGRITGGTIAGWRRQISTSGQAKCISCSFVTNEITQIHSHHTECVLGGGTGPRLLCAICKFGPTDKKTLSEHCKTLHLNELTRSNDFSASEGSEVEINTDDEDDDNRYDTSGCEEKSISTITGSDSDQSKSSKKPRNLTQHVAQNSEVTFDRKVLQQHVDALRKFYGCTSSKLSTQWTLRFRTRNYSSNLYEFAQPCWNQLSGNDCHPYNNVPLNRSLPFAVHKANAYNTKFNSTSINENNWQQLDLYGACVVDKTAIAFCGGPIVQMEWLPLMDKHNDYQMLAICCKNNFQQTPIDATQSIKCLIQMWRIDHLVNDAKNEIECPKLMYSIAYDNGPILQMKFCPSGTYSDDRLGLLAVSAYNGDINILSLPNCDNISEQIDDGSSMVLSIEPAIKLQLNLDSSLNCDSNRFITKMTWSEASGHSVICCGYSNGLVAIWDLDQFDSPLLCRNYNGSEIKTLLPIQMFYGLNCAIKQIDLHHDCNDESRWLCIGGSDRKLKFYDLQNPLPVEISSTLLKSRITSGTWPKHWTIILSLVDDSYSLNAGGVVAKQPIDMGIKITPLFQSSGYSCDISFSDWLNMYLFVNDQGDIHGNYPSQMLASFADNRRQYRVIYGYTDVVDIPENIDVKKNIIENNSKKWNTTDFGIVFCDMEKISVSKISTNTAHRRASPVNNDINLCRINQIAFNPNANACNYYALGYETGFLRIMRIRHLDTSSTMKSV